MSCMRKACLRRNFKVEGVETERNMVQSESKREYTYT